MGAKRTRRIDYWKDPEAPEPTSRKTSASVFVRDEAGRLLLLRRVDNGLWTIPTGGVKKGETVGEAGVRECREETGLEVEVTGLVGVFSTPDHVIVYLHGDRVDEVRQPINICLRARVTGGRIMPEPSEAAEVRWVDPSVLDEYPIHPALRTRIDHGLRSTEPCIS
ncbi:NUDIX domain-containing protein [Streptomyces clavuligerus]|uniref:ADP-ribose pyrophosphatase n=1 Tax=Streptomyces clavuligerus TaxID=1901 RepID=B5GXF0_STRCL|nr:NUDIX domain-containing protein [Streptomyces clavuligerus]ANW20488.1 DNA mismatch repair protein MutT [Streptomyces clavuligerus]AXU15114.1 NUDIX domain-containing protein [Streptomyces clavuligerus]EDY50996.1 NUDIX hydrolase [Streptomyces clavuligerus]EFG06532.1 ADP-ribose pyrophosphatase [Streptomyces clavuligerus]MBY6305177.1 NUDIX domain-containing protein [Streptomyces clavuligerus]